jgi:hypothetical protein
MKKLLTFAGIAMTIAFSGAAFAQEGESKSKFYDFSDQVIDGEIKKPTALYTDSRQKVKFDRLLKLKKSFLPSILETSKERVFK